MGLVMAVTLPNIPRTLESNADRRAAFHFERLALDLRAAAYRQLDNPDLAEDNVEQALKISPSYPAALLERGYLRRAKGDLTGARTDWLTVIQMMPNTEIANEAQKNIEKLDIK